MVKIRSCRCQSKCFYQLYSPVRRYRCQTSRYRCARTSSAFSRSALGRVSTPPCCKHRRSDERVSRTMISFGAKSMPSGGNLACTLGTEVAASFFGESIMLRQSFDPIGMSPTVCRLPLPKSGPLAEAQQLCEKPVESNHSQVSSAPPLAIVGYLKMTRSFRSRRRRGLPHLSCLFSKHSWVSWTAETQQRYLAMQPNAVIFEVRK